VNVKKLLKKEIITRNKLMENVAIQKCACGKRTGQNLKRFRGAEKKRERKQTSLLGCAPIKKKEKKKGWSWGGGYCGGRGEGRKRTSMYQKIMRGPKTGGMGDKKQQLSWKKKSAGKGGSNHL